MNLFDVKVFFATKIIPRRNQIIFVENHANGERSFFCNGKANDSATVDTRTFNPMLFEIELTTVTLIKFIQNSDLNKNIQDLLT